MYKLCLDNKKIVEDIKCLRCGRRLTETRIKQLDGEIYCSLCYNVILKSDDTPSDKMTFITDMGSSYYGSDVYYDHQSQQLIGHSYMWHIDDWQEYTGWRNVSLEEVLEFLMSKKSFSMETKEVKLLCEFFGEEVNGVIKKIK